MKKKQKSEIYFLFSMPKYLSFITFQIKDLEETMFADSHQNNQISIRINSQKNV